MIDLRAFVVLGLALSVNLLAQDPEPAPSPQAPPAVAETKGAEHWIRDLGSDSYQTRLKAEGALRKLGKGALPALKKAAENESDSEVQWRARRLVRQIEKGANEGLVERPKRDTTEPEVTGQDESQASPRTRIWRLPQGFPDGVREQFESLFEHFERDFGLDIPRARFFEDDFFKDLQEQMKSGRGTSQGTVLQIGPDGSVHVEISERNEKGEVERKAYDAPDMQSFQQQYPDVLKKNGLYLGLNEWPRTLRGFGGQAWPGFRLEPGWKLEPNWQPYGQLLPGAQDDMLAPAPAPVGKRLGIVVHPIPAELREHLDLEQDSGLMVESVQEGSLAESLGLQRGDIVVEIESTAIGSAMDVQKVLGGIEAGKQVEVKFLRKGKETKAKATKTEAVEEPKKLEAKKGKNATIR